MHSIPTTPAWAAPRGGLATALLADETMVRGVTPLREVHAVLITRTASHFGIALDQQPQHAFHYLYPPL